MSWNLHLDDEWQLPNQPRQRYPKPGYTPAASSSEAIALCEKNGLPDAMSLDFALGDSDTVLTFIRWMIDYCSSVNKPFPKWSCHSRNPDAKEIIKANINEDN